ncbi:MAG: DUF2332 family protein [Caulobacteraceae bacterium]
MSFDTLSRHFQHQARGAADFGSPFYGRFLALVGEEVANPPYSDLLAPWTDTPSRQLAGEAVALRLAGGLRNLMLEGIAPRLAELFPPTASDWPAIMEAARQTAADNQGGLAAFMRSPPQTNEVGRALVLFGGFLEVARRTGRPLRCLELGASAGLNLNWDAYRYDFAGQGGWGDEGSPVRMLAEAQGLRPPLEVRPVVAERAACDQNPIDLTDSAQVRRLQAYVWPDQVERMLRLNAAIAVAQARGARVERADAGDWAAEHVHPKPGLATVVYHSIFWQYPPEAVRERLRDTIAQAGADASADAPFAWLRFEPTLGQLGAVGAAGRVDFVYQVRLTLWPGGEDLCLATAHTHGAWLNWQAPT